MKKKRFLGLTVMLVLVVVVSGAVAASISAAYPDPDRQAHEPERRAEVPTTATAHSGAASQPIIIDHTCTNLSEIPDNWIEQAKALLRLSYGHTSHGSQPISGMGVLMDDPSYGGLYDFNTNGAIEPDTLSLADYTPSGDLGNPDRTTWATRTREYLNGVGSDRNVVVWSWCGQADTSEENINLYLSLMNELEQDYPDVTFVYMTGHLNGTGVDGNLNQRNEQIRDYCTANNKVLFDFADIESYDPDGNYFLDRGADDYCDYDSGNWANEWCAANPGDPLCASCSCAHSRPLNCNLKARAFWWMLARLAGWDGGLGDEGEAQKTASTGTAMYGQTVTYTIAVQGLTTSVDLTDEVPTGLSYLPGTLSATVGTVTDTDAPILRWSGVLSPTPAVTVPYAVTVNTSETQLITNTATIVASGYEPITSTAAIIANAHAKILPLVMRNY
jgi:uncharacterized repeat protein (TIGR01451 family)